MTAAMIGAVLSHAAGGRKGVPAGTRFGVLVTRARHDVAGARAIAAACRDRGVDDGRHLGCDGGADRGGVRGGVRRGVAAGDRDAQSAGRK